MIEIAGILLRVDAIDGVEKITEGSTYVHLRGGQRIRVFAPYDTVRDALTDLPRGGSS